MKVSFYTTCMGRLKHLKRTLPQNIIDNLDYANCEFVVLNYNSRDGMEEWMRVNMMEHIHTGKVIYIKTTEPKYFSHNHAKNLVARCCTGDILCGIDADNYTALGDNREGLALHLNEIFKEYLNKNIFVRARGWDHRDKNWHAHLSHKYYSSSGKIAVLKKDFYAAQGYDEHLKGHYFDEEEFWKRLNKNWGFQHIRLPVSFSKALGHTNYERLKNLDPNLIDKNKLEMLREKEVVKLNKQYMDAKWVTEFYPNGQNNQEIFNKNMNDKIKITNNGHWGEGIIFKNFDTDPIRTRL